MGRPPIVLDLAKIEQLAREGHTDAAIARACGFSRHTIARRKKDSEAFAAALEAGREQAHSDVSNALWRQAKKGNVQAITWYEKTRRGFKDQVATEQDGTLRIVIEYEDATPAPAPAVSGSAGDRP